jgi:hypothetical protein
VNLPGFLDENRTHSHCCTRFFTGGLHALVRIKAVCPEQFISKQLWQIFPPKKAQPACCYTGQLGGHDPDGEHGGKFRFD